jgi:hypothetical protein
MKPFVAFLCSSSLVIACGGTPRDTGPQPSSEQAAALDVETTAKEAFLSAQQALARSGWEVISSDEADLWTQASAGDMGAAERLLDLYEQRGVSSSETAAARQCLGLKEDAVETSARAVPGQSELCCIERCALEYYACLAVTLGCGPFVPVCTYGCIVNLGLCHDGCPDNEGGCGGGGDPPPPPPPPPPDCQHVCCDWDSNGNCTVCATPPQVCP